MSVPPSKQTSLKGHVHCLRSPIQSPYQFLYHVRDAPSIETRSWIRRIRPLTFIGFEHASAKLQLIQQALPIPLAPRTLDRTQPPSTPKPKMRFSMLKSILSFLLAAGGLSLTFFQRSATDFVVNEPPGGYDIKFPPDDGRELFRPPLRTEGRHVVDALGKRFKLASVNWYGASDEHYIPGGLDVRHRSQIARMIRQMGFNSVRLPYSDELVLTNPQIPATRLSANEDLVGRSALQVFEAVVNALTDAGLAVIINNHITQSTWCCGANPCDAAWYNDYLGSVCRVWQSEEQWMENWQTVMAPFVNNSRVIGADLRNEVCLVCFLLNFRHKVIKRLSFSHSLQILRCLHVTVTVCVFAQMNFVVDLRSPKLSDLKARRSLRFQG